MAEREGETGRLLEESVSAQLKNGYWPNNRNGEQPRTLASVYAVEALASLAGNDFRIPLDDLMDRGDAAALRHALRVGAETLLQACEGGGGLIGALSSPENPYLTGLALFRLSRCVGTHADIAELCRLMTSGLLRTASATGWEESSAPTALRSLTRVRATLRCAARLSLASSRGLGVPFELVQHAIALVETFVLNSPPSTLDSPDYACALIALRSVFGDLFDEDTTSGAVDEADVRRRVYGKMWIDEFENLVDSWTLFKTLNVQGYSRLSAEYEEHLHQLRQLRDWKP